MRMWTFAEQVFQDLRFALRMVAAKPAFTIMALVSLALGIGANTAIYSFMDAILMRALPVQNPESLVMFNWHTRDFPPVAHSFSGSNFRDARTGFTSGNFPYPLYELLLANHPSLSSVFAFNNAGRLNMLIQGQADLADGEYVSGTYFAGLKVASAAGRLIDPTDDRPGSAGVTVLSFSYAQKRFGDPAKAPGQVVRINDVPFTVIGVAPPEFFGVNPEGAHEVYLPMRSSALFEAGLAKPSTKYSDSNYYWVEMMGRLAPGASLPQAQAALSTLFQGFVVPTAVNDKERADLPSLLMREGANGLDFLRRQYSKPLYILMSFVGLILVIACANVANLLLARAAARRREMAVRLSLGAGRARVVRQLLTESLLLASLGGALGIFFAHWGILLLTVLIASGRTDFQVHAELNWHVLGLTLALSMATGLLFGLAPALQSTGIDLTPALKQARGSAPGTRVHRSLLKANLTQVLVVAQIAISLMLLVGAGLFVRTLSNLHSIHLGFLQENLLLFNINAKQAGYRDEALARFYGSLHSRLAALPGVRNASVSTFALVSGTMSNTSVGIPGKELPKDHRTTSYIGVGPAFFTTMQIPILLGREIDSRDQPGSPRVAVANELFVKTFFPGENPVGRHFTFGKDDLEIVGVSKNARYHSLKQDLTPVIYLSYNQDLNRLGQVSFEIRSAGDPLALTNSVRKVVQEADARIPLANVRTQELQINRTISQERSFATLCTAFAVLAMLIACVGLYGTMAYNVARRTCEIGIRMALGAERPQVVWMVLREVLVLTGLGLAIGVPAALLTSRFLESFLFQMKPNDPLAISLAGGVLLLAALAAGYAPARRASRIDPMVALRQE